MMPVPPAVGPARKPDPLPDHEVEYPQVLRGGRHRWWKPILSIPMFVVLAFIVINVLSLALIPIGLITGHGADLTDYLNRMLSGQNLGPVSFALLNVTLAVLIPVAMFTVWAVHRVKPGFLISVEGRFRWRWFARCLLVLLPLWVIYLGISTIAQPPTGGPAPHYVALIIIVLLSTPLQCAGEEFAFRGFLIQVIGSWFRRPLLALLVPLPFSVGLFALAHGSLHVWVLVDLGSFAAATFVLAWRTGGLEAGIALHMINNMLLMLTSLVLGGWGSGFVDQDTTGDPVSAGISVAVNALAVVLVLWQAKRTKLRRTFRPADVRVGGGRLADERPGADPLPVQPTGWTAAGSANPQLPSAPHWRS